MARDKRMRQLKIKDKGKGAILQVWAAVYRQPRLGMHKESPAARAGPPEKGRLSGSHPLYRREY